MQPSLKKKTKKKTEKRSISLHSVAEKNIKAIVAPHEIKRKKNF